MKYADEVKNMSVMISDGGLIELTLNTGNGILPIESWEVDPNNPLEDDWFEFIYKDEPYDLNIYTTFSHEDGEDAYATIYSVILDGNLPNNPDYVRISIGK